MKNILLLTACLLTIETYSQVQKGLDIFGETFNSGSGNAVSMPDRATVGIGAVSNGGSSGAYSGHVRIYKWTGLIWIQKGSDIDGEAAGDRSGRAISMPDSNTVAIGADRNDGNGSEAGHVRIYAWNGSNWIQKGGDIDGEAAGDESGFSVSMPDSNTVAIGAPHNTVLGYGTGHVRVYSWDGTNWIQKGSDIDGELAGDESGYSVSMPDSNTMAIGAHQNDGSSFGADFGHVKVYKWNGSNWTQKGMDIDGEAAGDRSGWSVSMPDSNCVAIGSRVNDDNGNNAGHVRVFSWNGNNWIQKGSDIDGEAAGDFSGCSVSMPDSNHVAIGATDNDGNGNDAGHVRVYRWNGINWIQKGVDVDGVGADDLSGWSVSMPDTTTFSVGAPNNANANGSNAGHVRVFAFCDETSSTLSITACDSLVSPSGKYTWTTSGTYLDTIPNALGCDSMMTINLTINNSSSASFTQTACDSLVSPSGNYTWTSSGTYLDTIPNAKGCDSVMTFSLSIDASSSSITQTICDSLVSPSGNYTWISSGTYMDTISNAAGCDSVMTFNLTINNSSNASVTQTVCDSLVSPSGNYTWITSGIYMDTIQNAAGCDSVMTFNLTINNSSSASVNQTACDSLVSPSGNYTWTSTGTYMDTISNAAGCDSVMTFNLTINNSSNASVTQTACDSLVSPSGNYTWTSTGTYMDTITNTVGCDSVMTFNLTINNNSNASFTQTACNSLVSPSGNYTWTTSGIYMDTILNAAGCDSVITFDLTVNNSSSASITETACDSLVSPSGNYTWTVSGTYMDTIPNATGCDSVITISLTIDASSSSITQTACDSLMSPSGNHTWTSSGTYMDTILNAVGCDSIITVDVTINSVSDISTTNSDTMITANNAGASYRWLDCNDNYAIIEGETEQAFTAETNGSYAVEVTENGCVDTSACVAITTIGIIENGFGSKLTVYPNPTHGNFSIDLGDTYQNTEVVITNVTGAIIDSKTMSQSRILNFSIEEPAGIYFISIKSGDKSAVVRVIKE